MSNKQYFKHRIIEILEQPLPIFNEISKEQRAIRALEYFEKNKPVNLTKDQENSIKNIIAAYQ